MNTGHAGFLWQVSKEFTDISDLVSMLAGGNSPNPPLSKGARGDFAHERESPSNQTGISAVAIALQGISLSSGFHGNSLGPADVTAPVAIPFETG